MPERTSKAGTVSLIVNGERVEVEVLARSRDAVRFALGGREYLVEFEAAAPRITESGTAETPAPTAKGQRTRTPVGAGHRAVTAPIPGVVVAVLVAPGQAVVEDQVLLRLEAMKMENNILAPRAGIVSAVQVRPGDEVSDGQLLLELEA